MIDRQSYLISNITLVFANVLHSCSCRVINKCMYLKGYTISETETELPEPIMSYMHNKLLEHTYPNIFAEFEFCSLVHYRISPIRYKTITPIINRLFIYNYLQKMNLNGLEFYIYRGNIYNTDLIPLVFYTNVIEYDINETGFTNPYLVKEKNVYINPIVFKNSKNPLYRFIINDYIRAILTASSRDDRFNHIIPDSGKVNIKIEDISQKFIKYIKEPYTTTDFDKNINTLLTKYINYFAVS